jgi:hypothetical protein
VHGVETNLEHGLGHSHVAISAHDGGGGKQRVLSMEGNLEHGLVHSHVVVHAHDGGGAKQSNVQGGEWSAGNMEDNGGPHTLALMRVMGLEVCWWGRGLLWHHSKQVRGLWEFMRSMSSLVEDRRL